MSGIGIQLLDKHWRLVLGGTCALAIGVIALGFVAANHLGSAEVVTEATDSSFETPATFEVTPALPPILAQADVCLAQCNGGEINEAERTRIKLPYQFADLLKKPRFRAAFDALIAKWPAEYAGLAHLRENDRKDLPFEGKAEVVLKTPSGRLVQIYDWIGYPDREWSNSEELRRPEGILKVVVDLTSGEMVAIFNGSRTLSEYHFNGSDDLLAPLLAYMVADEFHMQKLVELDFPKDGPRLAFPLAGDDLANASARLRCLEIVLVHLLPPAPCLDDQADEREIDPVGGGRGAIVVHEAHRAARAGQSQAAAPGEVRGAGGRGAKLQRRCQSWHCDLDLDPPGADADLLDER